MKWYPCELHCHTLHSDGGFTVPELLATAKERELRGICLTDHNTVSGWAETENSSFPVVLRGIEYTTYHGHMLCLGTDKFTDWRRFDNIDEPIEFLRKSGGIVGIAHPFQLGTPICTGGRWDYEISKWENVNYMEIFSEGAPYLNAPNKRARKLWHSLLDKGYRITPTMGRDWHRKRANTFISACTYLLCGEELSDIEMKTAIEKGRTVVSAGPLFYFKTQDGETIGDSIEAGNKSLSFVTDFSRHERVDAERKITPDKIVIVSSEGEKEYPFTDELTLTLKSSQWYSAELWGSIDGKQDMLLALTAPIYTK
ncbi:MAG: CehA/McbA family metallohydrolase [Acutalibacteraceae bacterium]|nr:CehA/McbA family metallohydrolase [Acutalibacteraceae bacterium]